jgi:hypothetical protein
LDASVSDEHEPGPPPVDHKGGVNIPDTLEELLAAVAELRERVAALEAR